jgi:type II secretory ATPase GspE/PulE/Tfp pilus assembly ATPase PilB-like protein
VRLGRALGVIPPEPRPVRGERVRGAGVHNEVEDTLAAIVDLVNQTRDDHLITIEDPVEFVHNNKKSLIEQRELHTDSHSFPEALKHVLRQDPDVILIGEIRDGDTATMALRAAQTGHLVLSTVHDNDASGAVPRLKDLGMRDHMISSSLICVIAQRLVRGLCPHCKQPYDSGDDEHRVFGIQKGTPLYAPVGCPRCIKKRWSVLSKMV